MPSTIETVKIFFSYAHEDEQFRNELEKHLRILRHQKNVIAWHDNKISPGTEWAKEINKHLNEAQIILLLVSPDFMDSDYCYTIEMKRALERHEKNEARVIPIILRYVYWADAPFSKLQALPKNGKPVKSFSDQDEAYFEIATGIQKVVKEFEIFHLLNDAENQFKKGKYETALNIYNLAIENNEIINDNHFNLLRAYLGKGNILQAINKQEEALKIYDEALELDPKSLDANMALGLTLLKLERYEEAINLFEKIISVYPKNEELYQLKGDGYMGLKLYKNAIEAYDKAVSLNPEFALAYFKRGVIYHSLENPEEALANYNDAIKYDPKMAKAYINKCHILYDLKEYKASLDAYTLAVRIDPELTRKDFKEKIQIALENPSSLHY